jgi:hypothetical protein
VNFTASATQNGETVTSVTLTPNAAGASATTAAGLGYTVTPSLATGGNGFLAANYNINYTPFSGTVGQAALTVTATGPSKTYGTALTAGASTVNFSASATQNGETVTTVTLTPDTAGSTATTPAGASYTVTPSAATGTGGFSAANYNITYNPFNGTVSKKPLSVTATGPLKTYGTVLTAGPSTQNFTADPTGVGSETVTSVTLTPDAAGLSATTAAGAAYVITPSAATGTGGFLESNYQVTYNPYDGIVSAAGTTTGVATSGSPSLPTDSVTFTATITAASPSTAIPTGTVQFQSNGNDLGTPVTVDPTGVAQTTITASSAGHGNLTITAVYVNTDGNFTGSTGTLSPNQVVDTPPVGGTHSLVTTVNTPLNVSASTLGGLDFDADGDALTVTAVNSPSANGGTVSLSSGTITYTPPSPTFAGADTFTYTVSDGFLGGTATSTANVTVQLSGKATSTFTSISSPSAGIVDLRGYGIPGHSYDVQRSPDSGFSTFTTLATVTAAPNGIITYEDDSAPATAYYRFAVH